MTIERDKLRWNGWGWNDAPDLLGERAEAVWAWFAKSLGMDALPHTGAVPIEDLSLPPQRFSAQQLERLHALLGEDRIKTSDYERAFHARGQSYHDLLHLRAGDVSTAPGAVAYPETAEEVAALLEYCDAENVILIPYGGGSSVVGGVTPRNEGTTQPRLTLDTTRMDKVLEIDAEARTARVQSGIYGPQLEEALQTEGFTLGHYPQSFEFSTLGGWIAHRGAGQQSNKYGKPEKWLVSVEMATPQGLWRTEGFPASAAGPQLTQLAIGSEGILGVITEATVKIQPVPEKKDYRAYIFSDFESGANAARAVVQSGVSTAMIRLSDANETFFFQALRDPAEAPDEPPGFCVMLVGIEGDAASVNAAVVKSRTLIESLGAMHMGEEAGQSWYASRFASPYLRDPMMDRGIGIDTVETATRWSNVMRLHEAVSRSIADAILANPGIPAVKPVVMAHISHSYADGSSLYFTFAFPRDLDGGVGQWRAIKRAVSDAIVENGGTISHHHGVGTDHLPWMQKEKGPVGTAILRAVKEEIDPKGILNPGKLIG